VEEGDFKEYINENSLKILPAVYVEPSLTEAQPGTHFQFLRKGYFCADVKCTKDNLVFNRAVTLKDTWAKEQKKG
jgi:glutaminyl-tRNA synthetase